MAKTAPATLGCTIRVAPPPGVPEGVQFLGAELAVSRADYWGPDVRELPTSFLDVSDRATRDLILSYLNRWDCGVTFVWSQSGGVIRITTGAGGHWSYLGKGNLLVPAGQPTMNLQGMGLRSDPRELARVIPHEGFHALGGVHEHLRREIVRDIDPARAYPYYARTQGWGRSIVDSNVLRPLDEASVMASPVDVDSIMAYPIPAEITFSGRAYPGGADITPTDRAFCLSIYPRADSPPAPPTPPSPPVEPPSPKPPVEPDDDADGFPLTIGATSDEFTSPSRGSVLFRFDSPRRQVVRVEVTGPGTWNMALASKGKPVPTDDPEKRGRSMVLARVPKGTTLLKVSRKYRILPGRFRVSIEAVR